jgi:hypothetical protein
MHLIVGTMQNSKQKRSAAAVIAVWTHHHRSCFQAVLSPPPLFACSNVWHFRIVF